MDHQVLNIFRKYDQLIHQKDMVGLVDYIGSFKCTTHDECELSIAILSVTTPDKHAEIKPLRDKLFLEVEAYVNKHLYKRRDGLLMGLR